jgi:hypothetical protein
MAKKSEVKPIIEQSNVLSGAFDFLNEKIFDGALSRPMLIFTRSKKVTGGYFAPEKWSNGDGKMVHELSVNANLMEQGDEIHLFGIIVHEMTHQWQHEFGKPGRGGYHNREWADKCLEIGLQPKSAADPECQTGDAINTTLIEGGKAMVSIAHLPDELTIPWYAVSMDDPDEMPEPGGKGEKSPEAPMPEPKAGKRTKYTCPACGDNLWGKSGIQAQCLKCNKRFIETV